MVEVNAELLVDTLSVLLADPVSEKLNDTVKAEVLVDALTNTLEEMEARKCPGESRANGRCCG